MKKFQPYRQGKETVIMSEIKAFPIREDEAVKASPFFFAGGV